MPVRRYLGTVDAPEAHHEWRPLDAGIAGHRREIAALYDRRPLQIPEVHDFGWRRTLFFVLTMNAHREHRRTIKATHTPMIRILFIRLSFVKRLGLPNWPKDTPPTRRRQLKSISQSPIKHCLTPAPLRCQIDRAILRSTWVG